MATHARAQRKAHAAPVTVNPRQYKVEGCGSFAIETKAQSFHQIDGVLSVPTARIRGDIDTPAGYLVHPRQV